MAGRVAATALKAGGKALEASKPALFLAWAYVLVPILLLLVRAVSATIQYAQAKLEAQARARKTQQLASGAPPPPVQQPVDVTIGPMIPLPSVQTKPLGTLHLRISKAELLIPDDVW